jgi:hypothetical protein
LAISFFADDCSRLDDPFGTRPLPMSKLTQPRWFADTSVRGKTEAHRVRPPEID